MKEASFYETIKIKSKSTTITLENEDIEEAKSHNGEGIFARALVNGNWGFASSTNTDRNKIIRKATKYAKNNLKKSKKELADIKSLNEKIEAKVKENPASITPKQKVKLLKEAKTRAQNNSIKNTKISYSDLITELTYTNSEGSDAQYKLTRTGASAKAVAKQNNELQTAQERVFGTKGFEIFKENNFLEKCEEMGNRAKSLLDAKKPPSGKLPTILDPELAGVFIHEALGHAAEGDLVAMNNSILKDKIGEKIGTDKVTVKDDPSKKGLFGYYPFDWEGVTSEPTTIIENGELKNYLNSRESATKTNTKVTSNFRSQSFSKNPIVRMSNTYLESGKNSKEELIEDISKGILLKGSRGGQVSPGEGNFQFNAEEGYIIRNGELKDHIKDVSLTGNTLNILNNIEKLSKQKTFSPGRCGKAGQMVPVTDGAPYTKISEALIGGENDV